MALQQGQNVFPYRLPAKSPQDGSSWRVGDGGNIMANSQFRPVLAYQAGPSGPIDLVLSWDGEEGSNRYLLHTSATELTLIVKGYFYTAPM